LFDLVVDEALDFFAGCFYARLVGSIIDGAEITNVVPAWHDVAIVDGNWNRRGVGKDEAYGLRRVEFGHDGWEVVAVCAEAVHPDDGGVGGLVCFEKDVGEEVGVHGYSAILKMGNGLSWSRCLLECQGACRT